MPDIPATVPSSAPPQLLQIERRQCVRYALDPNPRTRFLAQPGFQFSEGLLKDASAGGFCLVLDRPLAVGARLVVQLPGRRRGSTLSRSARVLRVEMDGAGQWLVGCQLTVRLSDEELRALISASQARF